MRGGFVRGGHSRSHPPESSLRRKQDQTLRLGKKGRMDEEGQAFVGDMNPSLTPREENWMQDNEIPREDIPVQKRSFSDTVKQGRRPVEGEVGNNNRTQVNDRMEEERDNANQELQQPEITVEKVNGIYNFNINEAAMKKWRSPWWDTLIVKLLGRRISLTALTRRLETMWGKMESLEVIDLGNDFFLVKFFSHEDLDFALTEGPWKILDHYLSIRFWTPNFNPEKDVIDRIAAWVRLPGLAIEYYEETMLSKIGNVIGRTLKVDTNTADKRRGKFARLCVELNLAEPLVGQYSINGVKYKVEYEGLHLICFDCGKVGHDKTSCPRNKTQAAREEVTRRVETHVAGDGVQHADDEEGQRRSDKQDNLAEDNFVNTKIDKSKKI
ncbi:uncharacterized protein LOC127744992 [Arachis duranensis]|uniref:Uncharacterized protein LOC127744992 n=1 Tax=Arachis duranensis TaxID=130453 RepID=A0A9C6WQZ6_ARADU|nr:uncharacterized protein LOC127744992 [Arachis duranensis]